MERAKRASRFIIEQRYREKDAQLLASVMETVAAYLNQSDDVTFLSDGERRYGNTLFTIRYVPRPCGKVSVVALRKCCLKA